jgi:hypothetical protein
MLQKSVMLVSSFFHSSKMHVRFYKNFEEGGMDTVE